MRLSKIRLAGFKSFVDPTTVQFPSNLVGILGPNGCGKSNVIDAVRWVMGESAASRLRGDSMADVIFSGSAARKPVGQASVELVFDNGEGRLGGQWASFAEIAVRRLVNRDGSSQYFLNGSRCRRRDITDLFLGTGLGPRSYAIIEQGMISRVIEARADELRGFFEEAAGISRYKERRRETETRIRHTRENLERLDDVREELSRRGAQLQRQARAAEQYRALRAEERQVKGELLAMRWRTLDIEVTTHERQVAALEIAAEAALAAQRDTEAQLTRARETQLAASDGAQAVQTRFYELGTEIARLEQALAGSRERRERQLDEQHRLDAQLQTLDEQLAVDGEQAAALDDALARAEPELEVARAAEAEAGEALAEIETAMQDWQAEWERFGRSAADAQRSAEVGRARIEALERQVLDAERRIERLRLEHDTLAAKAPVAELQAAEAEREAAAGEQAVAEAQLLEVDEAIAARREVIRQAGGELDAVRAGLESGRGRLASLETLQEAALGRRDQALAHWLQAQGLDAAPRLAEVLEVSAGWEAATEAALGHALEAVLVDDLSAPAQASRGLARGRLTLLTQAPAPAPAGAAGDALLGQLRGPAALNGLLAHVRTVADLDEALARRAELAAHECFVTADGTRLGRDWLSVARGEDEHGSVIAREREIQTLRERLQLDGDRAERLQAQLASARGSLGELEAQRRQAQEAVNLGHRELARLSAAVDTLRARLQQSASRRAAIQSEIEELVQQLGERQEEAAELRCEHEAALEAMSAHEAERGERQQQREQLRQRLDGRREQARSLREQVQRLALATGSQRTALASLRQALARLEQQRREAAARRATLAAELDAGDEPQALLAAQLEEELEQRLEVEAELALARDALAAASEALRTLEQGRGQCEQALLAQRDRLEAERLAWNEARVRRTGLAEQLLELEADPDALLAGLVAQAEEGAWQQRLDELGERVRRLGNVNLTAIEEYAELAERQRYLDAQHADLSEALATLENAIRKIDRETRARFRETFDKVNADLQALFPRLFGGGQAYLEMTGEDVLDAGVAIMAQPPGKKVANITLLSGGEKALTAVALVFAIFQLNPAPFCMLDEVDAPLDEANVGRFGRLLKEMSARVQFIFITHNKATMEVAEHLAGVTMHEPGVSRLVSVDMEEAVRLAAS
ncbi:chromosome segregation protein SMC [Plasticicumulans acidivorans]|uniref:Chromosome partition protein Smc n=1 Tax=Plasticicumulans acidivorans TaxID=886464 RepID=A0A317MRF2_9GAMM|nr:chromosome segregation protein SMC [Plasticicumulans acidivorans]PWV59461.1 condensin subunit Smc [Plasticicumulans acidivorans]